ncbi:MAG: ABC transporter permease [Candidatus Paceibacterota bacterium]|jgi:putative ABC transport system permease protein
MDYLGIIEIGIIFSLFVLGMILSFRLLGFADLTIEGSFTTGGAIFAILLSNGINPFLSILISIIGGGVAGLLTASLHCYAGINKLLSGIITLTMLYTANLRIMGRSNIYIEQTSVLNYINEPWYEFFVLLIIGVAIFILIKFFLSTNFGLYLRATGENESFVKNLKSNPKKFIIVGLIISNSLIALSGCLFAQYVGYSDIGNGNGMLVSMLTAMIIGENIVRPTTLNRQIISAIIGAISFQLLYSSALQLGLKPIDLKIMIGILLIAFLILTKYGYKGKQSKNIGANFI